MNQISIQDDFEFFQKAVSHLTGSLELADSMVQVYDFLKNHFPIDGISLHQFSKRLQALKLLFLVTKDRFQYVETILPLSEKDARSMEELENRNPAITITDEFPTNPIADKHRQAISHLIPYRPSSYLVGLMGPEDKIVGHLCFIGSGKVQYTPVQIQRMKLLLGPFSLAMSNMLQFKRVLEFQEKLYEEKIILEKTLHHLQDNPIIGTRGGLHKIITVVHQLKGRETPVLILGETGTGKELIADEIQKNSPRANAPFIKVNCGAIPENLIDSELFGYEKGAFTGANQSRPGRFEQANGGTLFLDEVGDLQLQAQVRFLRVLQDGVVERLGGKESISVNVRIIAATNRYLEAMVKEGRFREDLYYRLYVFPVRLPSLRERTQDIPALVNHFVKRSCARLGIKNQPVLNHDAMTPLKRYSWPGNIRELENLVERAIILSSEGLLEMEKLLPQSSREMKEIKFDEASMERLIDKRIQKILDQGRDKKKEAADSQYRSVSGYPFEEIKIRPLSETIKESITAALAFSHGRVNGSGGAAELLDLKPSTLRNKMSKFSINAGSWR